MSEENRKFDPNDLASLRARVYNLGKRAKIIAELSNKLAEEITELTYDFLEAYEPGSPGSTKRPDGRLTEAGVRAVEAAFEAGAKVTEVARDFYISPSAASTRRKVWLASKSNPSNDKPPRKKSSKK